MNTFHLLATFIPLTLIAKPHPSPSPSHSPSPSAVIPPISPLPGVEITPEKVMAWLHGLIPYGIAAGCLLVVWAVLGVVLYRKAPYQYWYLYGFWFLRWRMKRTWRKVALNAELTAIDRPTTGQLGNLMVKGRPLLPLLPVLCRIRPRRNGATAVIAMQPGQIPDGFVKAATAMAHAWRAHSVRVVSDGTGRGRLNLTIMHRDPLWMGNNKQRDAEWDMKYDRDGRDRLHAERWDLVVEVGAREDGNPWALDLNVFPHWLITGATQSGKSTLLNGALLHWEQRRVALVGIDCKGGMELGPHRSRFAALACDRAEAADLLIKLVGEAQRRMELCRNFDARNIWQLPETERPLPVIVIVDEIAELYLTAGREEKEVALKATTNLLRLAQLGAALGIHLIVAGQRFGSDLGPGVTALRAQLGGRVCLKVNDPETAEMTLGDLYPDAVEAAQAIGADEKGVAITSDTHTGWIRARSKDVSPSHLQGALRYAAKYHETPTLDFLN